MTRDTARPVGNCPGIEGVVNAALSSHIGN